jgi:addiction module HigA family antidote
MSKPRAAGPSAAAAFPPGEFIREELEARGWTQRDLAEVLGRPLQMVNQVVNGRKEITPRTAVELAAAFGTSAELWVNLESAYRLALAGAPDPAIAERARSRGSEAAPAAPKATPEAGRSRRHAAPAPARRRRARAKGPKAVKS